MMDFRENLKKCEEYIEALETERQKILVFQRELPLCLDLVTKALEEYKKQLCGAAATATGAAELEYSEQTTTSDRPILEEFIPIKKSSSSNENVQEMEEAEEEEEEEEEEESESGCRQRMKTGENSDWLSSAQLWNQTPDPPNTATTNPTNPTTQATTKQQNHPRKVAVVEVKNNGGGAFQPFQKAKMAAKTTTPQRTTAVATAASACSTAQGVEEEGGATKKDEKGGQTSHRKARRCWSPELHRRFINALQQLGGSHAATPKQIRELMKVDGLTNDEVKSHLQKYRLHHRRPAPAGNANQQAPQFVVVGGIWVPPPPEYAAVAAGATMVDTTTTTAPLFAPVAAPPPLPQSSAVGNRSTSCEERGSQQSDGGHVLNSNSSSTSSSAHTPRATPVY